MDNLGTFHRISIKSIKNRNFHRMSIDFSIDIQYNFHRILYVHMHAQHHANILTHVCTHMYVHMHAQHMNYCRILTHAHMHAQHHVQMYAHTHMHTHVFAQLCHFPAQCMCVDSPSLTAQEVHACKSRRRARGVKSSQSSKGN